MSFWSSQTLARRLPALVRPFTEVNIDCTAYRLSIGAEVYISPSGTAESKKETKRNLAESGSFVIPSGQFAFLLSEERISVPRSAIAFISIRTRIKFLGLVNVSGFHVDPGYEGRLIFAVFNAGPKPIHLQRGEQCFLIWYADLDQESEQFKRDRGFEDIPVDVINPIAGEVHSFDRINERLSELRRDVDKAETKLTVALTLAGSLLVATLVGAFKSWDSRGTMKMAVPRAAIHQAEPESPRAAEMGVASPVPPPRDVANQEQKTSQSAK